jgi:3-dehydroquinate dehydratase II
MARSLKILVANGVNLDLLGKRQQEIYGAESLKDLERFLSQQGPKVCQSLGLGALDLQFFQTNVESEMLHKLDEKFDGVVLNPAAWTHTSVALRDRLAGTKVNFVEVHISNLYNREEFRQKSLTAPLATGVVFGFGLDGYLIGLTGLLLAIKGNAKS